MTPTSSAVTSILEYMQKHVQTKGTVYKGDEVFFCVWMVMSAFYWGLLDISISLMLSSASLTLRSRYVFFCCGENKGKRQKQVCYNFKFGNIRRLFLSEVHTLLLPKLRDRADKILCDKIRWSYFGSYSKTVLTWIKLWLLRLSKIKGFWVSKYKKPFLFQSDNFWLLKQRCCMLERV